MPNNNDIDLSSFSREPSRPVYKNTPPPPKKRNVRLIAVNIVCPVVIVLCTLFITAMGILRLTPGTDSDEQKAFQAEVPQSHKSQSNILVMGYDVEEEDGRTDIMMVVSMDLINNNVSILQIPRDTYVDPVQGRYEADSKVNAAHLKYKTSEISDCTAAAMAVSKNFGIPLDGYIAVTITGFRKIVDILGGVEVYFEHSNKLPIWDKNTFKERFETFEAGYHTLNGYQAEGLMRKRKGTKAEGYQTGDTDRAKMQRIFYAGLMKKMLNMNLGDVISVTTKCYSDITTNLSFDLIKSYATKASEDFELEKIKIFTLPGQVDDSHKTKAGNANSLYSIHIDKYIELYNEEFAFYNPPITEADIKARETFGKNYAGEYWYAPGQTFSEIAK